MANKVRPETTPRVLVYGVERVGVQTEQSKLSAALVNLNFEPFDTDKKFHDFDGVIIFQSTFEKVELRTDWRGERYYDVRSERDELIRRETQLQRLLANGGWICIVLHTQFIHDRDWLDTDLSRILLNLHSFYKKLFNRAYPISHITRSEFQSFLSEYGAASTSSMVHR